MNTTKRYHTTIDLSAFTSTDDREGERFDISVSTPPTFKDIEQTLDQFRGDSLQRPPAFSAMKIGGQRAYKLARSGSDPNLKPRPVFVHEIDIVEYKWPTLELNLHVDKGFYVRSLARDIGEALQNGGHCASIRRTAVGPFTLEGASNPETLPDPLPVDHLLDIDTVLSMINF